MAGMHIALLQKRSHSTSFAQLKYSLIQSTHRPMNRRALYLPTFLIAFGLTGCVTPVQPWERGILAKPQMALTPDNQNFALMQHTYLSKEISQGGYGIGGGGCGCN